MALVRDLSGNSPQIFPEVHRREIEAVSNPDGTAISGGGTSNPNVVVTNFPATQPVSGTVSVNNFPASQAVTGTVAVSSLGGSLPAGSNAIGSVSVSNFPGTQTVSGSVSVSNFPATQAVSGTVSISGTVPVSGTVAIGAGAAAIGSVSVSNFPGTQPVSGTVTVAASSNVIGKVGIQVGGSDVASTNPVNVTSPTNTATATPTVSTTPAYTSGDCVGSVMTFTSLFRSGASSGVLNSANLRCKSVQTAEFVLYLFKSNPTAGTYTDNAACSINATDFANICGMLDFATAISQGTNTLYQLDGIGKAISGASTIYGILVTKGTPTLASTSDISIDLVALSD